MTYVYSAGQFYESVGVRKSKNLLWYIDKSFDWLGEKRKIVSAVKFKGDTYLKLEEREGGQVA